jgi:L-fucose mutarotase
MLKSRLQHPEILAALGHAGHGAQVLIADGNYPLATRSNPACQRVYLALAPGLVTVTDVLAVLADTVPIEAADGMLTDDGTPPAIHEQFRDLLPGVAFRTHQRDTFYELARGRDLALAISTGEQRTYANVVLTIGVVQPDA